MKGLGLSDFYQPLNVVMTSCHCSHMYGLCDWLKKFCGPEKIELHTYRRSWTSKTSIGMNEYANRKRSPGADFSCPTKACWKNFPVVIFLLNILLNVTFNVNVQ